MSQRQSGYERKENDTYHTPRWVTEALIPHIPSYIKFVWEPAAGNRDMARVLSESFGVISSDLTEGANFLDPKMAHLSVVDAIITNPPYNMAGAFIESALQRAEFVAMLLRSDFDSAKKYKPYFADCPGFAKKLVLTKRIVWFVEANGKPKASPSTTHAWYIWDRRHTGDPTLAWAP